MNRKNGLVFATGDIDTTGIIGFTVMDTEAIYIIEVGAFEGYLPSISNFTWDGMTLVNEMEIGLKELTGTAYWDFAQTVPMENEALSLYFWNVTLGDYQYVADYMTDASGVFTTGFTLIGGCENGIGFDVSRWQWRNSYDEIDNLQEYINMGADQLTKDQWIYFTPKRREIIIVILVVVILEEETIITIFLFFSLNNNEVSS